MAPVGNGRPRAESPSVRKSSVAEKQATSENNKPVIAEKAKVQANQTKASQEKAKPETTSRSFACSRKIVLSFLSIACIVAIGAVAVLYKADASSTAMFASITEALPGIDGIVYRMDWILGLIVGVAIVSIIAFRKSIVSKIPRPFAKKQA
mmetsp:Transcript_116111/g.182684  ORF Transcript_116111/g.182684 Transcript_116111/m.182684 type:complete len:151 (-) Transcript_116111:242-694(-)|eukprot:CAMPEP_0169131268 /NCGR_PEP_ID=MMETSP1015-20121227/38159_1 /TAXON_ID=342587 /ORGANISM="Karlodinium micrum, Strain CCMP2283" /LENGTH=150 /DNA_ID=CAMNT_0009195523 /DNA_START=55 /DNA_END=507 /DNA_ORIENTATION=+